MVYFLAWILFTIILLGFTLARSHPYRFSRFLAFESILSLIFLNAPVWFLEPFSVMQILSWICLIGSLYLVGQGFFLIKTKGNPEGEFEDTTSLITSGVYEYIRHPLYTSLLLFSLGVFLKDPSLLGIGLVITTIIGVYLTARTEEGYNLERFGGAYQDYMDQTKRFIPKIF
ncbi:MAG: isoprenylcysteine carboxylmethyltransferase family protein [Chloroflexota bacterium]|nr:MAG: isoprenylcysteine carboxylmethyltransferase family protein [Chloroflexota bacterium]